MLADSACGDRSRVWLCHWVENVTDNRTAAHVARYVSPWLSILLIALLAFIVNRILRRVIKRAMRRWERSGFMTSERRHQRAVTIGSGLSSFAAIIVWVIAILWMLSVLGVSAATLLTSAGLIGVALAFGAQNLLRDLISGTFIIFEDQLGVGDVVDLGVASGTVEEVTLRTTRLRDVEGVVWYVPNGEIRRVGNKSQQWSRAVVDVPISTSADVNRAQRVIKETADAVAADPAWAGSILDPPEVWGVESFTLDAVTIRLVVKTAPSEQWRVAREMRARIKPALDAAGIVSNPFAAAEPLRGDDQQSEDAG
jgi:small conductance mechanosensitive channel